MKAIVVTPGVKDSIHMRDVPDPPLGAAEVAVKTIRVGLCGTDGEINQGLYGKAPDGSDFLILGHENFGVVAEVGKGVTDYAVGDLVVATVRRPCGHCYNCLHGENDMCTSGDYQERGIMRRHGYLAEYYVESPAWLNRIPAELEEIAVLLEPMSVVEKGIDQAFLIQRRLEWQPRTALVLGAGPVGLLAAAVLRARGLDTHVVGREPASDYRAGIAKQLGATYHSVEGRTIADVRKEMAPVDLAVEATGASSVAFAAMQILGPNGVLCLLSVTGGFTVAQEPIDRINQQLVLGNQVVFGSVNANPRHFKRGVEDFAAIERQWPGVLKALITSRLPWSAFHTWFAGHGGDGIKSTLEVGAR